MKRAEAEFLIILVINSSYYGLRMIIRKLLAVELFCLKSTMLINKKTNSGDLDFQQKPKFPHPKRIRKEN